MEAKRDGRREAGFAFERSHAVHTVVLTVDLSRCLTCLNSDPGQVFIQVY